ncbi:MAG: 23S rRNA (adenine(2503)-C(2))-methyltransferase RlmN [Bacteroidia bacterium]|nr:23S rRNA (adenine(2503)-C(2))-methyltransferase RlmN [Bacteroidia bacterium]
MHNKQDIRNLSDVEIQSFFVQNNEKPYRIKQLKEWLWKKGAGSFIEMSSLPLNIRELLDKHFNIHGLCLEDTAISGDGSIKFLFRLFDGKYIESVLIPTERRVTACISTQVGCKLGCKFCGSGKIKFQKDLSIGEIFAQIIFLQKESNARYNSNLTNIVIMGMGEPLLNYFNLLLAIEKITSVEGLNISPQRVTVSTAGIPEIIRKFADLQIKFNLAVSLHAANNHKRSFIMPVNKLHNLDALLESLLYFYKKTYNKITFEYILLDKFNDTLQDAKELALLCNKVPCKINIVEYNSIELCEFQQASQETLNTFVEFLRKKNFTVNIRKSRGNDIFAACGQLANKKI